MSRYTGPINKKSRRYNFSILENDKEFSKGKKRTIPTTYKSGRVPKQSNYGLHLYEKQKVKYMYGLSEKQFKTTFQKASNNHASTIPKSSNNCTSNKSSTIIITSITKTGLTHFEIQTTYPKTHLTYKVCS